MSFFPLQHLLETIMNYLATSLPWNSILLMAHIANKIHSLITSTLFAILFLRFVSHASNSLHPILSILLCFVFPQSQKSCSTHFPFLRPWYGGGSGKNAAANSALSGSGQINHKDDEVPSPAQEARNTTRRVPPGVYDQIIPSHHVFTAADIITSFPPTHLPPPTPQSARPVYSFSAVNFSSLSTSQPHLSVDEVTQFRQFLSQCLPHQQHLRDTFDTAWTSGRISISAPTIPDYHVPLWAERFLEDFRIFNQQCAVWYRASSWLHLSMAKTSGQSQSLASQCYLIFGVIPYHGTVPGFSKAINLSIADLASLLGDNWLNDDIINAGGEYIINRLGPESRQWIANCFFIPSLRTARQKSAQYSCRHYVSLNNLIINQGLDTLYIPLFVSGNHWAVLKVEFSNQTYTYIDSLNQHASAPTQTIELLTWWLESLLPSSQLPINLSSSPPTFVMVQHDSHSCGVIVLCMLGHLLLGDVPWTPDLYHCGRMEWFLRLANGMTHNHQDDHDQLSIVIPQNSYDGAAGNHEVETYAPVLEFDHSNDNDSNPPSFLVEPDFSEIINEGFSDVSFTDADSAFESSAYESETSTMDSNDIPSTIGTKRCRTSSPNQHLHDTKRVRKPGGVKPGTSYHRQKATKLKSIHDPSFQPNNTRLHTFRAKILNDDVCAEFDNSNLLTVRCSACSKWITLRLLYDTLHWKNHRRTKRCRENQTKTASMTPSLLRHGFGGAQAQRLHTPPLPSISCPGLRRSSNHLIDAYFFRSNAAGGGAPSKNRIATQLFGTSDAPVKFIHLAKKDQHTVLRQEELLFKWKNSRAAQSIFATNCEGTVFCATGHDPSPCTTCESLYKLHTFQVRLKRPIPKPENMKHVPKTFRDEELGNIYLQHRGVREIMELDDGRSPWLKFAQGIASGLYNKSSVLLGMIEAMVHKMERSQQGKSLANMGYTKEFGAFCDIMASLGPRCYKTFQHHFGGPTLRSLRKIRARSPRFAPGIVVLNVEAARNVLLSYDYNGPLALSWDDTELEPALDIYHESKEAVLLLGCASGPATFHSLEELDAFFDKAKFDKASKLRIWLLTIPLPKIPPILLAAVAHGSSITATTLHTMHTDLTKLLFEAEIYPISQSCDGSATERALQVIIHESAESILPYRITHVIPGYCINLEIPIYRQHPSILTQDSKHGRKTARNQLSTGARFIVLANFCIFFLMIYEIAENVLSPLFKRDVDKVDKQDDQAAARLFSFEMLEFQMEHYPTHRALTVYLFVMGELIDAWQSRNITHLERAKMVIRARFFLMAWRSHIVHHPDHSVNIHFISRESFDIFMTLCDSLLALIIAYRKFYPTYPLLPWLHSSEPCEHVFGILRQLKKDFTYSDMLSLEPKLRALLLGDFGNLTAGQKATQTSAGYHHTYFKADDLDLHALLIYPSDDDLTRASLHASSEARDLLATLGIEADPMVASYSHPPRKASKLTKPRPREPQTMVELMTLFKDVPLSRADEDEFEACEFALAAEAVDKSMQIDSLQESPAEETAEVKATLASCEAEIVSPKSPLPDNLNYRSFTPTNLGVLADKTLSQTILVTERKRHQTRETSLAIRRLGQEWGHGAPLKEDSLQDQLCQRLRSITTRVSSTGGVGRQIRHNSYSGSQMAQQRNKGIAEDVVALEFLQHRATAFRALQVIHESVYTANISAYNPLRRGHLILALHPANTPRQTPQIVIGEVVAMYKKGNSRSARHIGISEIKNAGLPSYIYIQTFAAFSGPVVTSLTCPSLSTTTFLQIPRTHLLFSLAGYSSSKVEITNVDAHPLTMLTLGSDLLSLYSTFMSQVLAVDAAVHMLRDLTTNITDSHPVHDFSSEEEGGG